jgi:hypothetical protein
MRVEHGVVGVRSRSLFFLVATKFVALPPRRCSQKLELRIDKISFLQSSTKLDHAQRMRALAVKIRRKQMHRCNTGLAEQNFVC